MAGKPNHVHALYLYPCLHACRCVVRDHTQRPTIAQIAEVMEGIYARVNGSAPAAAPTAQQQASGNPRQVAGAAIGR